MSADPTPTAPPPPAAPRPGVLVEFVRTERANAAYVILGLAAAFLAGAVYLATQANKTVGTTPDTPLVDPRNPDAPPRPAPEIDNPKKGDYWFGCIGAGVACLICASAGVTLLVRVPPPGVAEQRSWTRGFVLVAGGLLGLTGFLLTVVLLVKWNESVVAAIQAYDTGGTATARAGARWLVQLLIGMVASLGVVFLAIQPARAEERNHQNLRRLVYGGNLVLTVLLLFDALLILNVVFAFKVPNTLDTTATGFYTLSDATKTTVANLTEPVTAYVILPDDNGRETNDVRQMIHSTQDISNGKFIPRFVSPVTDKTEVQRLYEKFNKLDKMAAGGGVLLTVGDDARRHEFISFMPDLIKMEPSPTGGQKYTFVGEASLVQKLRVLGDSDSKLIVYFTQGNGELSLGGAAKGGKGEREATRLKAHLETYGMDVRPLDLKAGAKAEVPADAAIVVVADPIKALPEPALKALKDYMTRPAEPAKKGKMMVLAEARPGGESGKMAKTGLESLLAEFNVKLGDQYIYSSPDPLNGAGPRQTTVVFGDGDTIHPIVAPFPRGRGFYLTTPREVAPLAAGGPGPYTATRLLGTTEMRATWLETEPLDNPMQAFQDLLKSPQLQAAKSASEDPRSVAVAVTEGGAPPNPMNPHAPGGGDKTERMVVFATADRFSNAVQAQRSGPPLTYELFSASLDWLRGREPIAPGIVKDYATYQLPMGETINTTRLYLLPIGLALLAVAGLGAGVWVIRRK